MLRQVSRSTFWRTMSKYLLIIHFLTCLEFLFMAFSRRIQSDEAVSCHVMLMPYQCFLRHFLVVIFSRRFQSNHIKSNRIKYNMMPTG